MLNANSQNRALKCLMSMIFYNNSNNTSKSCEHHSAGTLCLAAAHISLSRGSIMFSFLTFSIRIIFTAICSSQIISSNAQISGYADMCKSKPRRPKAPYSKTISIIGQWLTFRPPGTVVHGRPYVLQQFFLFFFIARSPRSVGRSPQNFAT